MAIHVPDTGHKWQFTYLTRDTNGNSWTKHVQNNLQNLLKFCYVKCSRETDYELVICSTSNSHNWKFF